MTREQGIQNTQDTLFISVETTSLEAFESLQANNLRSHSEPSKTLHIKTRTPNSRNQQKEQCRLIKDQNTGILTT